MDQEEAKILLERYRMGLCTHKEEEAIRHWYEETVDRGDWAWNEGQKESFERGLRKNIMRALHEGKLKLRQHLFVRIAAAASLLLVVGLGGYLLYQGNKQASIETTASANLYQGIVPGSNKAILTLANGREITLDSAANGKLVRQGNAQVVKLNNGMLAYNNLNVVAPVVYNTLHTPMGGQYRITLPDGTKVWLNAASSLKYPTAFTGNERLVEVSGEAYFEVAKNATKPFTVQVNTSFGKCRVKVLGTQFNIHAYNDEYAIKTTLISGAVKVEKGQEEDELKPGQQAVLRDKRINVLAADTAEVTAWKKGLFIFKGRTIQSIMTQVARWYDIKIIYDNPPEEKFYVNVPRATKLSNLFKMLGATEAVHFKVEGKTVTVTR